MTAFNHFYKNNVGAACFRSQEPNQPETFGCDLRNCVGAQPVDLLDNRRGAPLRLGLLDPPDAAHDAVVWTSALTNQALRSCRSVRTVRRGCWRRECRTRSAGRWRRWQIRL